MSTSAPDDASLAIYKTWPQARVIPHMSFGHYPTRVKRLDELGAQLGMESLWVKRDDETGGEYGGNKVRKLEFLLGEARAQGYQKVWTTGAIGSHHALATAIYAQKTGFKTQILHYPQPVTPHVLDNLRALSTTYPEFTLLKYRELLPLAVGWVKLRRKLPGADDFYYIPGGGSSAQGIIGYINAAFELKTQIERDELPAPDAIFVAAGTCGTLAGLILGAKMAGLSAQIIGVRVVDKIITNAWMTAHLANQAADILRRANIPNIPRIRARDVTILDAYFGREYGAPTEAGERAMALCEKYAHFSLDPTYTGKTFAAIIGEHERLDLKTKNVLYWHTLNSVDLAPRIARADVDRDLPPAYQQFFKP